MYLYTYVALPTYAVTSVQYLRLFYVADVR